MCSMLALEAHMLHWNKKIVMQFTTQFKLVATCECNARVFLICSLACMRLRICYAFLVVFHAWAAVVALCSCDRSHQYCKDTLYNTAITHSDLKRLHTCTVADKTILGRYRVIQITAAACEGASSSPSPSSMPPLPSRLVHAMYRCMLHTDNTL